jgi:hypothetical protein
MHIMRYEVVDLVIREISLFFACVDQLFDIVELVVKSQKVCPQNYLVPLHRSV